MFFRSSKKLKKDFMPNIDSAMKGNSKARMRPQAAKEAFFGIAFGEPEKTKPVDQCAGLNRSESQ